MAHDDIVAAHAQHDDEGHRHAGERAGLQRACDADGEARRPRRPWRASVWPMQRLAEEEARQQRGDERRGAEHDQHVGDRREAKREDEGDEASGKQHGAREQGARPALRTSIQHAAALPEQQWQHRDERPGRRSPERHVPCRKSMCRTMTPAVLKIAAAPMAHRRRRPRVELSGKCARFHGKKL